MSCFASGNVSNWHARHVSNFMNLVYITVLTFLGSYSILSFNTLCLGFKKNVETIRYWGDCSQTVRGQVWEASGRPEPVGGRSDQFWRSVGLVGGRRPWKSTSGSDSSYCDLHPAPPVLSPIPSLSSVWSFLTQGSLHLLQFSSPFYLFSFLKLFHFNLKLIIFSL